MILSLERIFAERQRLFADEDFEVHCSYLEVYNEVWQREEEWAEGKTLRQNITGMRV